MSMSPSLKRALWDSRKEWKASTSPLATVIRRERKVWKEKSWKQCACEQASSRSIPERKENPVAKVQRERADQVVMPWLHQLRSVVHVYCDLLEKTFLTFYFQ